MDFGIQIERKTHGRVEDVIPGVIDQTRAARESGFDLMATGEHFLLEDLDMPSTMPLLSRLTAEMGSMSVATSILLAPFHHPVQIAEDIASLDVLAESAYAGLGAGYRELEFESFGIDKSERGPRLSETIELVNKLWTEETVSYSGEFYSVDGVSSSLRPEEKPPVWVAANSGPAIRRAANLGDAWFINPHSTLSEIAEQKEEYDAIKQDKGEDTACPIIRECFVAPTHEEAIAVGEEHLAEKYRQYIKWGQDKEMDDSTEFHQMFEELREDRFILGTPAEVCEQLERMDEQLNISHSILRIQWPGLSHDRAIECIELIGDEVIPNL